MGQPRSASRRSYPAPAHLRDPDDGVEGRANVRRSNHVLRTQKRHAAIFCSRRVSLPAVQEPVRLLSYVTTHYFELDLTEEKKHTAKILDKL